MKRWIYRQQEETEIFQGINKEIQRLLRNRGISTEEEMREFLSDDPALTYDPFLLKGMKEAVTQIKEHIDHRGKICIYGDYDVDGITAVCLLTEFLENLTPNVSWYIPSRREEGYGVNKSAMDTIKAQGTNLLITVDCGISSYEEVAYAKNLGMDVIVTDHHTPGDKIVDCTVINPKQQGCKYPFKELCGCGVAYKLLQALQKTLHLPKSTVARGLDIVAIATIADIVPLVDENRTIIKHGLKRVRAGRRPGLSGLIRETGLHVREITAGQIAFIISPHINAGGRVDSAHDAMELLRAKDAHKIKELAQKLVYNNNVRKELQQKGIEEAKLVIGGEPKDSVLVVLGRNIHEGVAGIVAGKLKDEFYRPVLIVTESKLKGILKGTGRSIQGVDLYELLKTQENLLIAFGGHKAACGFTIDEKYLETFRIGLQEEIQKIYVQEPDLFEQTLLIDQCLLVEDLTEEFVNTANKIEPCGYQNPRPIFSFEDLYVANVQFMGKQKEHVKFYARDKVGKGVECIMFNGASLFRELDPQGNIIDIAGVVNMNKRGSSYNVQIVLEDMRRR